MLKATLRILALAFGLGLALSACSSVNPPTEQFPPLSFSSLPPYELNVGRIEVVSDFKSDGKYPHIEYDMPLSPEDALKRWVQARLHPIGRTGTLRVVIHDASATEVALKTDHGFTGLFKKEQAARVQMTLNVSLQMLDDRQFVVAEVTGKSERDRTRPEGQTLNQRDQVLYSMVDDLLMGFNAQVDPNIGQIFTPWLGAH